MLKKTLLVIFLSTVFSYAQETQSADFQKMIKGLCEFSVDTITFPRLEQLRASGKPIYILDTREKNEFDVSHIEGAKYVGYNSFTPKTIKNIPKNAIVVTYCSVGYRSEKIGEKLLAKGYSQVYNLYGGIFNWVNNDHEVKSDYNGTEKETEEVHAYDRNWGKWLKKGKKVY